MVDCSDFLDGYSDFRDGLFDAPRQEAFTAHLEGCASCARYDRVIGRGAELFRDLPEVEPSYDFMPRLQHRIYHLDDSIAADGRRGSGSSVLLTFAIAAAIGVSAWAPAIRPRPPVVQLPPVAAHAPERVEAVQALFHSGPLLTPRSRAAGQWEPTYHSMLFRYSPWGSPAEYSSFSAYRIP